MKQKLEKEKKALEDQKKQNDLKIKEQKAKLAIHLAP